MLTNPHVAARLKVSRATPLLPLCVSDGMLWGDLYLYYNS